MKILHISLICLVLLSCSQAPERYRSGKGSGDSTGGGSGGTGGGGSGGGGSGGTGGSGGSDPVPPLAFNLQRLEGLSFKALIDKLAHTAGVDPLTVDQDAAFKKLLEKRYILGDYNYSIRNAGSTVWETTDIANWTDATLPYCQSATVKTKYKSDPKAFTAALLGRDFSASDQELLTELGKVSAKADEVFEMNCVAHINSLEFRNQWPKAQPSLKDYVNFIAGSMLHLPSAPSTKEANLENLEAIIGEMTESKNMLASAKSFLDHLMQTSGKANEIDYDLPSNILMAIIREKQPYGAILYSDTCYDNKGAKIKCDSGTPKPAGILSTRAFLKSRYGAYNIFRASAIVNRFMCSSYPLLSKVEPGVEASKLVPKFAATDGEGFGNGSNCYACHAQFARHTQYFVKFDPDGLYKAEATGIEDKTVSASGGYTTIGTMASHFLDPAVAGSESSAMLGKPVEDLQQAGKVLGESDIFLECQIRHLLQYYLRLSAEETDALNSSLIKNIRATIVEESKEPTLQLILKKALSHPQVVETFNR